METIFQTTPGLIYRVEHISNGFGPFSMINVNYELYDSLIHLFTGTEQGFRYILDRWNVDMPLFCEEIENPEFYFKLTRHLTEIPQLPPKHIFEEVKCSSFYKNNGLAYGGVEPPGLYRFGFPNNYNLISYFVDKDFLHELKNLGFALYEIEVSEHILSPLQIQVIFKPEHIIRKINVTEEFLNR